MGQTSTTWAVPIAACICGVLSLITCVAITTSSDVYIGGISYPYFSDTGRDAPAYYVFAVGLTITAVLIAAVGVLNWRAYRQLDPPSPWTSTAGTVCIELASPCLALLACLDTCNNSAAHSYAAYAFFVFAVCFVGFNTAAVRASAAAQREKLGPLASVLARSAQAKVGIACLLLVAFVIYIPIGLAVVCTWGKLGVQECLNLGYGADYCAVASGTGNDTETCYDDYSGCKVTNEMRAGTQHICIVCLMAYFGSVAYDLRVLGDSDSVFPSDGVARTDM